MNKNITQVFIPTPMCFFISRCHFLRKCSHLLFLAHIINEFPHFLELPIGGCK